VHGATKNYGQSIRNQLPGTIKSIISDKVLSEVIVETGIGEIASVITARSVGRDEAQNW
jgi:molybdopterin-binding protein